MEKQYLKDLKCIKDRDWDDYEYGQYYIGLNGF